MVINCTNNELNLLIVDNELETSFFPIVKQTLRILF